MGLGSACVPRAGERVLAIANFVDVSDWLVDANSSGSLFWRDAQNQTRETRALPRNAMPILLNFIAPST